MPGRATGKVVGVWTGAQLGKWNGSVLPVSGGAPQLLLPRELGHWSDEAGPCSGRVHRNFGVRKTCLPVPALSVTDLRLHEPLKIFIKICKRGRVASCTLGFVEKMCSDLSVRHITKAG